MAGVTAGEASPTGTGLSPEGAAGPVDPTDLALLRVVAGPVEQASARWRAWAEAVDIDDHTSVAFELFPALYKRLEQLGEEHPWRARLKGVYRRQWTQSQLHGATVDRAAGALRAAGIDVLAPFDQHIVERMSVERLSVERLSGERRLVERLPDRGAYPRFRPELTVPWGALGAALSALADRGWTVDPAGSEPRPSLRQRLIRPEWELVDAAGHRLAVSDRFHPYHQGPDAQAGIWERAELGADGLHRAATADLVYRALGDQADRSPSLRWVLATLAVAGAARGRGDDLALPEPLLAGPATWDRIVDRARFVQDVAEVDPGPWSRPRAGPPPVHPARGGLARRVRTARALTRRWGGVRVLRTVARRSELRP